MSDFRAISNLSQHSYVSRTFVLLTHLSGNFKVSKDPPAPEFYAEFLAHKIVGLEDR